MSKTINIALTILAFIIAIVVLAFMEKNTFNIIIGSAAVVLGLYNVVQLIRRR
ncbi:hypothetical protein MKY95_10050 [Paenibacillus sp. FSL P4-0176]|uniref:hypothetical protein n=1 Tax=Paenibacillus sp. FSL P4-0176 TaxID=2921631 RepID=UPI0030D1DA03